MNKQWALLLFSLLVSTLVRAQTGLDAWHYADQAYKALAEKKLVQAAESAGKAVHLAPDNQSYHLLWIDLLARSGQKAEGRAQLAKLKASGKPIPPEQLLAAAYAAQHLSDNSYSAQLFREAIDAHDAKQLTLTPAQVYNVRQAVTELERQWGVTAALGYGSVGVMNPAYAPSTSRRKTLQTSIEAYWRPPVVGLRDGTRFELYGRVNQALYDGTGGATGSKTTQGVVGVRWKPLARQNVILAAEKLFRLGKNARNDLLLRTAWSDGDGLGLYLDQDKWRYWQVYTEADYFLKEQQFLAVAEGRYGYSYKTASDLVLTPMIAMNANYDSVLHKKFAFGAGSGLNVRYWFRENHYQSAQSFIDINVQYRFKLAGDSRAEGLFTNIYFSF